MHKEACKAAQRTHCADPSFGPRYSATLELYKKYSDPEPLLAHVNLYSIKGPDPQTVLVTGMKTETEHAAKFVPPYIEKETTVPLLKIRLEKLESRGLFLVDAILAEAKSVRFMSRAAGQSLLDLGVVESVEHLRYGKNNDTWSDDARTEFQVTRHAHSCNNANAGKSIGFHKDGEPSLSSHGIDTSLKIASPETTGDRFQSSFVVVSPLIRTWMTAVLLYAQSDKTLQLLVSPHLKEHLKFGVIEVGNMPKRVPHQVAKFTKFLRHTVGPDVARRPSRINLLFPVRQGGVAIISIRWSNDNGWVVDRDNEETVKFDDYYGLSRRLTSWGNANGPSAWHSSKYYRSDGSLRMFTAWWKKNQHQLDGLRGGPFLENRVHIVCHSQVMKAFCRTCPSTITSQNLWSMRYHHTPEHGMVLEKDPLQKGANKPKPGSMTSTTRDPNQLNYLCGYSGSVSNTAVQAMRQQIQPAKDT